ncbi:MAG: large conductance mechanosensitive channel protein MscL [Lachnospiraceae bacterium]|nr:large conductance mechanosensitive channel protein MscL [Lachnospiraceae bacterium]
MKKFFKEFGAFIARGNVLDMAVGIIIGGAFTAIISSLVENIFAPLIGMILGGIDFAGINVTVGSAVLEIGKFLSAVITFILTAFVLFLVIKSINKAREKAEKKKAEEAAAEPEAPAEPSAEEKLLTEIRDLLKK